MPRIDPEALLKCLNVLLNNRGGIKGSPEVKRLVALMRKFSNKLVSKCIYVLILKETEDDLLVEFMAEGGWGMVFQWLGDAINVNNYPFIKEVMKLLIKCPINLDRLKENNCPKVIKGLSKDSEDPGVRELASVVVENWLQFIKSGRAVADPVATVPVATVPPVRIEKTEPLPRYKITVRDGKNVLAKVATVLPVQPTDIMVIKDNKVRDIEKKVIKKDDKPVERKLKELDRPEIKKKDSDLKNKVDDRKHKSDITSSGSGSSKHSSSSNRDKGKSAKSDSHRSHKSERDKPSSSSTSSKSKDKLSSRDKEKDEKSQADKDKDTLMKIKTPNIASLGKIPKKTSDSTNSSSASTSTNPLSSPVVRPPESPVLSTSRKGTYSDERKRTLAMKPGERPKTVKSLPTKFRSVGLEEEVKPPPSRADIRKKEMLEKKPDSVKRSSPPPSRDSAPPEKKSKVQEILEKKDKIVEKPGGIKLIPPKPKPVLLESDMFSDALTASAKLEPRKKKRRVSSGSGKESELKRESSDECVEKERSAASPPSDTKPNFKFYRDTLEDQEQEPPTKKDLKTEHSIKSEETHDGSARAKYYPEGVIVIGRLRRGPKKSVRWCNESDLVKVREFELDETERVNVTRNFGDMKLMERNKEREALLLRKLGNEDVMEEKIPWGPLFLVDVPSDRQAPEPGKNSEEVNIQYAREKTVLQAIYFTREMIPDSPAEPDPEVHPFTDPKPIPLEDATGSAEHVNDFSKKGWPDPKPEPEIKPEVVPPPQIAPSFPTFVPPMHDGWRGNDEIKQEMPPPMAFPPGPGPGPPMVVPPPMFGMGQPPFGGMPPDAFPRPLFPGPGPGPGFPGPRPVDPSMFQQGPPGNMMPMGGPPPGWVGPGPVGPRCVGWNGPQRPPPPQQLHLRNICHSWKRTGSCVRGDQCRFLHPGANCPPLN